jgi:hypothetical protein
MSVLDASIWPFEAKVNGGWIESGIGENRRSRRLMGLKSVGLIDGRQTSAMCIDSLFRAS